MPSQVLAGRTNVSVTIRIIDSTDGTPETAVEHNTAGINMFYRRELAARVAITEAALAALTTAHTDGGIEHISDGYYRLDVPDLAFATGVDSVLIGGTVTGMIVIGVEVLLTGWDPEDSVRAGLTALPNAAADAAGGLPISDVGGLDLDAKLAATNEVTAARMAALTDWINGGRLDLLLDAIPTTAMRGTDNAALASVATEVRLAELDAANLPTDVAAIPTTAMRGTDNVVLTGPTKAEMDTAHALLATPAQVNNEVVDVLKTDTVTLPGQAAPPLTPTFEEMVSWLYKVLRNRKTQTAAAWNLMADDETTVDAKATVSDNATTAIKQEIISGP